MTNIRAIGRTLSFLILGLFISCNQHLVAQHQSSSQLTSFQGTAADSHTIRDGSARYTVLSPYLIRLEYSEDQNFEDRPTFHAINRHFSTPEFQTRVENGWRIIRTEGMHFQYKIGAGPYSVHNTKVHIYFKDDSLEVQPRWNLYHCRFGAICEAETARMFNPEVKSSTHIRGDWISTQHLNYTGTGYLNAFHHRGSSVQWNVDNIPEDGNYDLKIRYAAPKSASNVLLNINGKIRDTLSFPATVAASNWRSKVISIGLSEGASGITLSSTSENGSALEVDHISVSDPDKQLPREPLVTYDGNLGGWDRGLGNISGEIPLHDGIIDKEGWYLLDDTNTPTWTSPSSWVKARKRPDTYQDSYLFGYGHRYKEVLKTFANLTGPPPLLPRWAFGIMFSRNHPYGAEDFTERIVPNQHDNNIPLDGLIIDTDFKSPDDWNGWNWRSDLFPHPDKFLKWTDEQGLKVALNIHPSINHEDPRFPLADSLAGGLIDAQGECPRWQGMKQPCSVWNWGIRSHNESYFALHELFEEQGVDYWWLDWCCDGSRVTMKGLTPDAWINQQYVQHMESQDKRGFSLSRIGSKWQNQNTTRPGPWAEHRNSVHFTGDTYPTWEMLKFQSYFTTSEGNIGLPYVSHDIGSYHGGGPRAEEISGEMYIRWVQFGAFQPIFRSHGHGVRLPWQFEGKARETGAEFMRLRQKLIPYLYTEAERAHRTGLPIARSMYLEYSDQEKAYESKYQYLFGTELLVAPIAQPGSTATRQVWLPENTRWYHFFTNESFEGGQSTNIKAPLDHIPVLASAGSIVPMGPNMDHVGQKPVDPLTLKVFAGADGTYTLYEDKGSGHAYRTGGYLRTPISYTAADSTNPVGSVTIGIPQGKGYEKQLEQRGYRIELIGSRVPEQVKLNGNVLKEGLKQQDHWNYNRKNNQLTIKLTRKDRSSRKAIDIVYGE